MKIVAVAVLALALAQDDFKSKWMSSYARAAEFLVKGQGEDGQWGREFQGRRWPSMALTVLATDVLVRMPKELREKHQGAIDKAIDSIEKSQDEKEGSWHEPPGQLKAYVTSIAIMALHAHDPARHKDRIERGQKYLVELQKKEGFWTGSTGYGEVEYKPPQDGQGQPERKVSDSGNMSTTGMAADALHESGLQDAEYWKRVVEFLSKCQNSSETTLDPEWLKLLESKGFKVGNDGGFIYKPDPDSAEKYGGVTKGADGKNVINSYGSMTYTGLKTYIYAGLKRDDPRVKSAVDWVRKHYNIDYHPGFSFDETEARRKGNQGLYYYYMAMTRALDAWGEHPFVTEDGKKHDWTREIGEKLVSLQKEDGSWVNEQVRWWEGDKLLCTPYVMKIYALLGQDKYWK
jgi:squalene-hopene/tetraprenyl-beta-curcumene cyclase